MDEEKKDRPKTVNIFLGFFFMLNLVVGTGFLGVPYAFVSAGLLAGAATLVVIAFVSWNCAIWELEFMARAQVTPVYYVYDNVERQLITRNKLCKQKSALVDLPNIHDCT